MSSELAWHPGRQHRGCPRFPVAAVPGFWQKVLVSVQEGRAASRGAGVPKNSRGPRCTAQVETGAMPAGGALSPPGSGSQPPPQIHTQGCWQGGSLPPCCSCHPSPRSGVLPRKPSCPGTLPVCGTCAFGDRLRAAGPPAYSGARAPPGGGEGQQRDSDPGKQVLWERTGRGKQGRWGGGCVPRGQGAPRRVTLPVGRHSAGARSPPGT